MHDFVLEREQQPVGDRGLRRRVVRVACLAVEACRGGDHHQRAVSCALELAKVCARGEERGRQVRAERLLPPLERKLPDGNVVARPDTGDRDADVEPAECGTDAFEERVDLCLVGEVRSERHLSPDCLSALAAPVVVHRDPGAFLHERACAGAADPAGAARHEHALAGEPRLHTDYATRPCASTSSVTWRASPESSSGSRSPAASRSSKKAAISTPRRSTPACAAQRPPARPRSSSWIATAPEKGGRSIRSSPISSTRTANGSCRTSGPSTPNSSSRAATPRSSSGCTRVR